MTPESQARITAHGQPSDEPHAQHAEEPEGHGHGHPAPPAPNPRRWVILTLLCMAQFMLIVDVTVVNVALPSIGDDLTLSPAAMTWVVTAYTLLFGSLLLLGGGWATSSAAGVRSSAASPCSPWRRCSQDWPKAAAP